MVGDLEAAQPAQEEASPWEGMVRIALMRMMADEARPECPATALHLLRPTLESPWRFFRECYTGRGCIGCWSLHAGFVPLLA